MTINLLGLQQAPNLSIFTITERGNLILFPAMGQLVAKQAYGNVGLGCWRKRMLCCNGTDTGLNLTWRESEQTSNWFFVAREFGEPE